MCVSSSDYPPPAPAYAKLLWLLAVCVLLELLCGRIVAKAGFFIPKSGVAALLYDGVAFAGLAAFNASAVLVYLLIGWTVWLQLSAGREGILQLHKWRVAATVSILFLAVLSLLRLIGPFGPIIATTYQIVYLVALLSCAVAILCHPSRRWWALPALCLIFSQLCASLFVSMQNLVKIDSLFLLGMYRAGEFFFLASSWAFLGVVFWHLFVRDNGWRALRQPAIVAAGATSVLGGAIAFVLCMNSPYPRQIVMFATGLTMSGTGVSLFAVSLAAAVFGFALCLLGKAEDKRIGLCFLLAMGCGYSLGLTHYYLLRALGLWLIAEPAYSGVASTAFTGSRPRGSHARQIPDGADS